MARVRSRSWQVLSARGLLACLWLPFALGAHTLQTCTLLDNLDWDHVLVVANLPLPGSGLSPLVSSSSPSAIKQNYKKRDRGAYFSTSGFRSRPGAEASSRKLLFFFLSGLGRGQTSQGISYEYSGTSSPPEPPDRSHSVDTTLSWGLQKPEGVENCWCPPKSREELERTLIRYCGGYEDARYRRPAWLLVMHATAMGILNQKWICDRTDWAHGDIYLPKCLDGWKCD